MAILWPAGVPKPDYNSSLSFGSNILRSPTDGVLAKQRLRFTSERRQVRCSVSMKGPARQLWEIWFIYTDKLGALPFELEDPHSGVVKTWRFADDPTMVELRMNWFRLTMTLEEPPIES